MYGIHTFIHTYSSWLQWRGETTFAALVVNFAKKNKQNKKKLMIIIIYEKAEISWSGNDLLHAKVCNGLVLLMSNSADV